jgi:hypothetical protein
VLFGGAHVTWVVRSSHICTNLIIHGEPTHASCHRASFSRSKGDCMKGVIQVCRLPRYTQNIFSRFIVQATCVWDGAPTRLSCRHLSALTLTATATGTRFQACLDATLSTCKKALCVHARAFTQTHLYTHKHKHMHIGIWRAVRCIRGCASRMEELTRRGMW